MSYESIVQVSQIASLLLFVALFAAALLYAFWPGNRRAFEEAAQLPLIRDDDNTSSRAKGSQR